MLEKFFALPVVNWFDPVFFLYNVVLLLFVILIAPVITLIYIRTMKKEKIRRLELDIPKALWEECKVEICKLVNSSFHIKNYLGSVTLLVFVIGFGISIILLLKPLPITPIPPDAGVDYSRGANFLMLGPFIEQYGKNTGIFYHQLIVSLTAFQFGFLGAFVYFIGHLARSYFVLDLTPHTFVDATIRMITGSVVALVLSFVLSSLFAPPASIANASQALSTLRSSDTFLYFLPMVSFFLGFFPTRGLLFIEKLATEVIRFLPATTYKSKDLSSLPGMSYVHELRLRREGFDNAENLCHGNALDLAIRTGFSYCQLQQWIDQAWLITHLRENYDAFVDATGLTSRADLQEFAKRWNLEGRSPEPAEYLARGNKELEVKLQAIYAVLP